MSGNNRFWAAIILGALLWWWYQRPKSDALEGEPAPDFTLPIVYQPDTAPDGSRLRLSDLKGQVVVLDFWASWCGPCKASVPHLNSVATKYRDRGVQFVGINSESLPEDFLTAISEQWGFSYPILQDGALEAARAYDIHAYPTVVVIDRRGIVEKVYFGGPASAALERRINNLLE
jgi:cytochrome c biogenesis protein CcmG/thiol:disulfide interchange protein DsbE